MRTSESYSNGRQNIIIYYFVLLFLSLLIVGVALFMPLSVSRSESSLSVFLNNGVGRGAFSYLLTFFMVVLTTGLMNLASNAFTILPSRTTHHASIYLLLFFVFFPKTINLSGAVVAILMLLSIFSVFSSYKRDKSMLESFQAFVYLGTASLFIPPILFLLPLVFIFLYVYRALSVRSFIAGWLGLSMPLMLYFGISYFTQESFLFTAYLHELVVVPSACLACSVEQRIQLIALAILLLISLLYYLSVRYSVRIRTRVFLSFLFFLSLFTIFLLLLYPQSASLLIPFELMCASFNLGHFFVHNRGKKKTLFFIFILLLSFTLLVAHLWM